MFLLLTGLSEAGGASKATSQGFAGSANTPHKLSLPLAIRTVPGIESKMEASPLICSPPAMPLMVRRRDNLHGVLR